MGKLERRIKAAKAAKPEELPETPQDLTVASMRAAINMGGYATTQPLGASKEERERYLSRMETLERYFKRDALKVTGLKDHKKARAALKLAYEIGSIDGTPYFDEIFKALVKIADLMGTLPG